MKLATPLLIALVAACSGNAAETGSADQQTPAAPAKTTVTNLDAPAAIELLTENKNVVVLDVRTPSEFAAGHIDGAVNIDFRAPDFAEKLGELDRSKPYLVHCRSGGRSTASLEQFRKLGFATVYHLDGGKLAWDAAHEPK